MTALVDERFLNLAGLGLSARQLIGATLEAMDAGFEVIAGGQLPDDVAGGRTGKPDLLIRGGHRRHDGSFGYLPADIKHHATLQASAKGEYLSSTLSDPSFESATSQKGAKPKNREADPIQLAHYWRMLAACGRNADTRPVGAIVGTDEKYGGPMLVWHELDVPTFRTFSRSQPKGVALRTALDRHDHEHSFRIKIAEVARQRHGTANDPEPIVAPIYINECNSCPWFDYCMAQLGERDASTAGRLSAREWLALKSVLGIDTKEQLAALDPGAVDRAYFAEVANSRQAVERLRKAVTTAQMQLAGEYLRRTTVGSIPVPRADLEIDLDVEWDRDNHVYLWGMLVSNRLSGRIDFEHISGWDSLDAASNSALAAKFWLRISSLVRDAEEAGHSVLIYHYSSTEKSHFRSLVEAAVDPDLPGIEDADQFMATYFVDEYPLVTEHFVGRESLGLKAVAVHGADFNWRDEDPGGLQSQLWLDEARNAADPADRLAARERILEYNEDDVRATAAVREWLSEQ